MIKVAVLFQDKGITNLDLRNIKYGNPGLGGTEYLIVLLCAYLKEEKEIDLTVYHFSNNTLPDCNEMIVQSEEEAFKKAAEDSNTIFLMKNLQKEEVYQLINQYDLKYIVWCHNFLTYQEIKAFSQNDRIKRVIAVGRQMYDYYIDDKVVDKMDYVFNMFDLNKEATPRRTDYDMNVTYIGSLIYQKSFHVLAGHWKRILEAVPDAKLHVIGTGKLYDRNAKLGDLGIAEASYEEMFLENLRDEQGKVLDSVIFHGLVGEGKTEIFHNTAVGVVNPLASTETFCLCAMEMEAQGIPVVSRRKNGLLDTVVDGKTGILYKEIDDLADSVIRLLKDRKQNDVMGNAAHEFAKTTYRAEKILPDWIRVFTEVSNDQKARYRKPNNHFENNGKRIRMMIHALHRVPFLKWIPSVHDLQKK